MSGRDAQRAGTYHVRVRKQGKVQGSEMNHSMTSLIRAPLTLKEHDQVRHETREPRGSQSPAKYQKS